MAVLSRKAVANRLELDIDHPQSLVVTPLLARDEAFDDDSLDLRLGSYFPGSLDSRFIAPMNNRRSHFTRGFMCRSATS